MSSAKGVAAIDIFNGPLSPLSSSDGSFYSDNGRSASSITSSITGEATSPAIFSHASADLSGWVPAPSFHTPSPHSSFDPGSVLDTPRKAKPLTRSPGARITGINHEPWGPDPDFIGRLVFSENGVSARLPAPPMTEEEIEAKRQEEETKHMAAAEQIHQIEIQKMMERRDLEVAEKERVLSLTEDQLKEENAHWDKHGTPHPRSLLWKKGVRFDVPESETGSEVSFGDSDMEGEMNGAGPSRRMIGREDTEPCNEFGNVIQDSAMETEIEIEGTQEEISEGSIHGGSRIGANWINTPLQPRRLGPNGTHIIDITTALQQGARFGPHGTHLIQHHAPFVPQIRRLGPNGTHLVIFLLCLFYLSYYDVDCNSREQRDSQMAKEQENDSGMR